jgi:hypothetical protein
MIPDPRYAEIPRSLLELVGEDLSRQCNILPLKDDSTCITLFCQTQPRQVTYEMMSPWLCRKLGRTKIEWIPSPYMKEALDEHFALIDNCSEEFVYQCPKTWHSLERTEDLKVRFCPSCQSQVHWCNFASEAKALAKEGKCVAISGRDEADDLSIKIGFFVE